MERRRSLETLVAAYWKPVYKYIRIRWRRSNEDAKDLTQELFAQVVDKGHLASFDPSRARFRTYLRVCVDGVVGDAAKAERRKKRGGGIAPLSLDFDLAERELADGRPDAEDLFDREWARALLGIAIERLREECAHRGRGPAFRAFEIHDLAPDEPPSYQRVADALGVPVTTVTNHLALMRRELRRHVLDRLREITPSEEEAHREARVLLDVSFP